MASIMLEEKKPPETFFLPQLFNTNVTMEMKNKHCFPLTPSMTGNLTAEMFLSKGKNRAGNCSEEHMGFWGSLLD